MVFCVSVCVSLGQKMSSAVRVMKGTAAQISESKLLCMGISMVVIAHTHCGV